MDNFLYRREIKALGNFWRIKRAVSDQRSDFKDERAEVCEGVIHQVLIIRGKMINKILM